MSWWSSSINFLPYFNHWLWIFEPRSTGYTFGCDSKLISASLFLLFTSRILSCISMWPWRHRWGQILRFFPLVRLNMWFWITCIMWTDDYCWWDWTRSTSFRLFLWTSLIRWLFSCDNLYIIIIGSLWVLFSPISIHYDYVNHLCNIAHEPEDSAEVRR